MIRNIMTVDLEDFYVDLPYSEWSQYDDGRVEEMTKLIIDLLEKHNAHATFFTLGYIAQRHPELIELVKSKGHEIASHSYSHPNISRLKIDDFERDLVKSIEILQKVSGERILGFRAPYFSINKGSLWAFDVLRKHLLYDSSIFPVRFHYGMQDAPRHFYTMSDQDPFEPDLYGKFTEVPVSTFALPLLGNLPIAGGIYLRFLPLYVIKKGIERINRSGLPAVLYIHPKDLDPEMPHIQGTAWHTYWGLKGAKRKFESILKSFEFSSVRETLSL